VSRLCAIESRAPSSISLGSDPLPRHFSDAGLQKAGNIQQTRDSTRDRLTPYLIDAKIFIQAKNLHYGFDFCPAFWEWLDAGNQSGTVLSIERVRDELIGGGDDLADWAKARGSSFFVSQDGADIASLETVSNWAAGGGFEAGAVSQFLQIMDYYLVAQALARGFVVVSHEVPANSTKTIKIPSACIGLGFKCMSPLRDAQNRTSSIRAGHLTRLGDKSLVIGGGCDELSGNVKVNSLSGLRPLPLV